MVVAAVADAVVIEEEMVVDSSNTQQGDDCYSEFLFVHGQTTYLCIRILDGLRQWRTHEDARRPNFAIHSNCSIEFFVFVIIIFIWFLSIPYRSVQML